MDTNTDTLEDAGVADNVDTDTATLGEAVVVVPKAVVPEAAPLRFSMRAPLNFSMRRNRRPRQHRLPCIARATLENKNQT